MRIGVIQQGHKMSDIVSQMSLMYEEDEDFRRLIDDINEIGCPSFMLTKEEIERMTKEGLLEKK